MGRSICAALAAGSLLGSALAADVLSFSVDDAPNNASAAIDPSFAGLGIEPSQLYYYMGGAETNQFSINLLNNLANFTGQPPYIRLGGNTQDYMIYSASNDEWIIKNNPNSTGQGHIASDSMLIGPHFFDAANRLPQGTPVTWGLNLAYEEDDYIDQIVATAQQIKDRCTNINLRSFEIGNEPDVYLDNGFRKGTWTGTQYNNEWTERAAAIYKQVLEPKGVSSNFFDAAATTAWVSGTTFGVQGLVSEGIDDKVSGSSNSYLGSWDQHDYYYFLGATGYPITLDYMLQLDTTETQFNSALGPQLTEAKATDYPYALREMGVVGPIGLAGVSDTFAAGLWTMNFLLYAASQNISSVQFHMTAESNTSAWKPTDEGGVQPFVRPIYYGMAAFDQTIGASCNATVAPASINSYPDGYNGYVKAYAVYQGAGLGSIVVINGKLANVSASDKPSLTVEVTLPTSLAGQTVHLSYLTGDGADATKGTTWNGLSFEQNGDGTQSQVSDDDKTLTVGKTGNLSITVRDTEAIVASFRNKIGADTSSDGDACSAIVTKGLGATATASAGSAKSTGTADNDDDSGAARLGSASSVAVLVFAFAVTVWLA
ncbi:Uu.00g042980.m01.CDS01 [Anthostomella pinea]|uniref:Uu.00g042980.m01.CDS01 n=1 Tax=Anthostomella pinea TaxID=933095 RepID=A0AAI8VBM3_9PEZI|nr:Uu.00g042980.m01.CDS01 [Anthostomella pinea]